MEKPYKIGGQTLSKGRKNKIQNKRKKSNLNTAKINNFKAISKKTLPQESKQRVPPMKIRYRMIMIC
jgi:hypothetical protein